MHWLDGLYRLVYSTAMREITRSISYSEMERLGIERIIILECGVCDCTPIYTSRQNTQLSWLLSPAALPTGHWLRLPKLLMSGSITSSKSSTLLLQQSSRQCCFLLWLNQTHTFAHLRSLNPFADIRQKFTLEGSSSRTSSLSAKKNNPQTTRNSDEILTPPCQMLLGHWRDTNVRVARARARRSQLVKQISTQPARDCQTES